MKLFLIGMPGSGKSTTAKEIAKLKRISFYDTDELIQKKYNMSIPDIFKEFGEKEFRKYEETVLNELIIKDNFIAATGGGLPCFNDNMNKMNDAGITIYLKTSIEILFQRLRKSLNRPMVQGKSDSELYDYLQKTTNSREPYYFQANYIIDADKELAEIIKSEPFNL